MYYKLNPDFISIAFMVTSLGPTFKVVFCEGKRVKKGQKILKEINHFLKM